MHMHVASSPRCSIVMIQYVPSFPQENAAQLRELGVVPAVLETLRMHCYGPGSEVPATLARTLNNIFRQ